MQVLPVGTRYLNLLFVDLCYAYGSLLSFLLNNDLLLARMTSRLCYALLQWQSTVQTAFIQEIVH